MRATVSALVSGPSSEAKTVSLTGPINFSNSRLTACSSWAVRNPMDRVYKVAPHRATARVARRAQMRGGEGGGTPRRSSHSALASWLRLSARTATYVERVPPPSPTKQMGLFPPPALPATDEGHLCRHHRQELHVGIEGKARHVDDGPRHVLDIHGELDLDGSIGLRDTFGHARRHLRRGIADIDLPAGDVVFPPVQGGRLRSEEHTS